VEACGGLHGAPDIGYPCIDGQNKPLEGAADEEKACHFLVFLAFRR
jgi:hypothetical protein